MLGRIHATKSRSRDDQCFYQVSAVPRDRAGVELGSGELLSMSSGESLRNNRSWRPWGPGSEASSVYQN